MKKKNANNAIDFERLFAVKDQLQRDESATTDPVDPSGLSFARCPPSSRSLSRTTNRRRRSR
jgi:hypothetical protein